MKFYYLSTNLTETQFNRIERYTRMHRIVFRVLTIREIPSWCCFIENTYDDIVLGSYLADCGFKTLNIDAVLDDLDRLTNNYKSKENKDEN